MINSQEIIERSIWSAINEVLINLDMAIDPNKYLPVSSENQRLADEAISKLQRYIPVYGSGNSQSKGQKVTPRIVINSRGFIPGSIGLPGVLMEKREGIGYTTTAQAFGTLDHMVDVHLVANNQQDIRLLTDVLFYSIPQIGYLKPYTSEEFLFSGNIFIQLVNFFDNPNTEYGIMEKVYQFNINDYVVYEKPASQTEVIPFITDIGLALSQLGYNLDDLVKVEHKVIQVASYNNVCAYMNTRKAGYRIQDKPINQK